MKALLLALILISLAGCERPKAPEKAQPAPPVQEPEGGWVPALTTSTPTEALLEVLRFVNQELITARKVFHDNLFDTARSDRMVKEIESLERTRIEILRILGRQMDRDEQTGESGVEDSK